MPLHNAATQRICSARPVAAIDVLRCDLEREDRRMNVSVERNQRHRAFWAEQNREADRLQRDPWIVRRVCQMLTREAARGVPVYCRIDLRAALSDADADRRDVLEDRGRRGGRARQLDPLQERIIEIVRRSPEITERELLSRLHDEAPGPVIEDVDGEEISFIRRDGTRKSAPLRALKDRLSRAKKLCRSF